MKFITGFLVGIVVWMGIFQFAMEKFSGQDTQFAREYCGTDYFFEFRSDNCKYEFVTVTAPNIILAEKDAFKLLKEEYPECEYELRTIKKL